MDLEKVTKIAEKIPEIFLNLGMAYWGYKTTNHPMGGVYAMLGYKLATNTGGASHIPNVSRSAGLAMLAHIGLMGIPQDDKPDKPPLPPPLPPPEGDNQITTTVQGCLDQGGLVIQTLDTYQTPLGPVTTCICQLPSQNDDPTPPKKQYSSVAECVADGNDVWYCRILMNEPHG